ncbi:hypothetical protein [Pseudomonas sp. A-RE-19]|uniref:hypothetical protein n=1 Tax=Pseudomonas sp. A-RE-19 TaxID=2832401 RepID=UPI001CBBE2DA|nr:hypothetical protein [Pseudomonas sp. A-RE-19]
MSIFQRIVLLLKVLVMLSLGTSAAAWAECQNHGEQASSGQGVHSEMMIAASESEGDDSTTDDPDSEDSEDDTQS